MQGGGEEREGLQTPAEHCVIPPAGSRRSRRRAARIRDHRGRGSASQRAFERPAPAAASSGDVARAPRDHQRQRQRDGQQRHEQVARAGLDRPARRPACRPPRAPRRPAPARATRPGSAPQGDGPSSRIANAATTSTSTAARNANSSSALATNSAVRSTGASRNPSNPPSSRSATNSRPIPSSGGEQQRHPQDPRGQLAVDVVALQREVEQHERAEREQHHRRHGLARAQLQPQVLAQQRGDGAPHAYSARTSAALDLAGGREQGRPAAAQPEHDVRLGQPVLDVVGDDHARPAGRSAARRPRPRRGPARPAARPAAAARARAAPPGRPRRAGASRASTCARGRRRAGAIPTASSSSSIRANGDVVQPGVEAQVLPRREVAVEQRVVAEEADLPAHRPALARQLAAQHASPSPRCGRSSVARMRSSVVLPAPLAPNTASVCPASSASDTPESATRSP